MNVESLETELMRVAAPYPNTALAMARKRARENGLTYAEALSKSIDDWREWLES